MKDHFFNIFSFFFKGRPSYPAWGGHAIPAMDHAPASGSAWASALAAMAALAVAMGIGRFAFTPILPMMQEDFALSVSEGGWLATANYLGYLVGSLSAIGMRIRPTPAIRGGLLVIRLSTAAMGLEHRFVLWVVLRAAAGVWSAWGLIFVFALGLERPAP